MISHYCVLEFWSFVCNCAFENMDLKETVLKAFEQNRNAVLYTVGAGVALLGLGIGYKYMQRPKKLTQVGVVSQLILHPLKSGKGLQVATAECLRMGLKYGELKDRCVLQQCQIAQ